MGKRRHGRVKIPHCPAVAGCRPEPGTSEEVDALDKDKWRLKDIFYQDQEEWERDLGQVEDVEVDMTDRQPVQDAIDRFSGLLDELETHCGQGDDCHAG